MSEFVAVAMSKRGGPCRDCKAHVEQGEAIYKYPKPASDEWRGRNGAGNWVCFNCMVAREGFVPQEELALD